MRIPFPPSFIFPLRFNSAYELGFYIFADLGVFLKNLLSWLVFSIPKIENGYLLFIYIPSDNKYLLSALCCLPEMCCLYFSKSCVYIVQCYLLKNVPLSLVWYLSGFYYYLHLINVSQSECTNSYTHQWCTIWNTFIVKFLMCTDLVAIKCHLTVELLYVFIFLKRLHVYSYVY